MGKRIFGKRCTISSMANKFDIYWADFAFEEDESLSKPRPVVVLEDGTGFVLGAKVTTHSKRDNNDMEIHDWEQAGLSMPSVVRFKQVRRVYPKYKIGHLSERDIKKLKSLIG